MHVSVPETVSTTVAAEWCEGGKVLDAIARPSATTTGVVEVVRPSEVERGTRVVAVRLIDGDLCGRWIVVHDPGELREAARAPSRAEQKLDDLLAAGEGDLEAAQRLVEFLAEIWRERHDAEDALSSEQAEDSKEDVQAELNRLVRLAEKDFVEPRPLAQDPTKPAPANITISLPVRLMQRLLFGGDAEADAEEGESDKSDEQDEERTHGAAIDGRRFDPVRSARFLEAATAARDAYLVQLRAQHDAVPRLGRLFEDLQVLMAPIHYGVRAGAVLPGDFARQVAPVLRAFLGQRTAALPRALAALSKEESNALWSRGELLLLLSLFVYNLWLAAYATTLGDDESVDPTMFGLKAVDVVRHRWHVPDEELDRVLVDLPRQLPRLRGGILWIAHHWPDANSTMSFAGFLERLLGYRSALCLACREGHRPPNSQSFGGKEASWDLLGCWRNSPGLRHWARWMPGILDSSSSPTRRLDVRAWRGNRLLIWIRRVHGRATSQQRVTYRPDVQGTDKGIGTGIDLIDALLLDDSRPELRAALEVLKRVAEE